MKEKELHKEIEKVKDNGIFSNHNDLVKIVESIDNELENISQKPFSSNAFKLLKRHISLYIAELVSESIKNANREKLDGVSATHVEKASNYLVSSTRGKVNKVIASVGGVLLGATLSNVVNMILKGGETSINGIIVTVILGIIGAFMLAFTYNK